MTGTLISRPAGRAWRSLPICPTGTCGRTLQRRISHSTRLSYADEQQEQEELVLPHPIRPNPALICPGAPYSATKALGNTDYIHPTPSVPPRIQHLLRTISSRQNEAIWHAYTSLTPPDKRYLTSAILSSLLLSLRPKRFLPEDARAYFDHFHPNYDPSISATPLARLPRRSNAHAWFMSRINDVLEEYRARRIPLRTPEYAHLLDCARATKNIQMARELWADMDAKGVRKDTKCYNTFIAALCGTTMTQGRWKTTTRTATHRARSSPTAKAGLGDPGTLAVGLFEKMLQEGLVPDTATYEFVLGAAARMGNLQILRALVWRCWGLDIASLAEPQKNGGEHTQHSEPGDSSPESSSVPESPSGQSSTSSSNTNGRPNKYHPRDKTLPLGPPMPSPPPLDGPPPLDLPANPTTLSNIAASFSRLTLAPTAITLVNHLSLKSKSPIPHPTWLQLLNWVYVLTRPPDHSRILPERTLTRLWVVLRSPPYSIVPDMEMYDFMVRHHLMGQRYKWASQIITEALETTWPGFVQRCTEIRKRVAREVGWTPNPYMSQFGGRAGVAAGVGEGAGKINRVTSLTTKAASMDLKLHKTRSMVRRWLELLIYGKKIDDDHSRSFRRRAVPKLIEKFGPEFLSDQVGYIVENSGYVIVRAPDGLLGMELPGASDTHGSRPPPSVNLDHEEVEGEETVDDWDRTEEGMEGLGSRPRWDERNGGVLVIGSGAGRSTSIIRRTRKTVGWRWRNRGNKYGELKLREGMGGDEDGGVGVGVGVGSIEGEGGSRGIPGDGERRARRGKWT